MKPYPDKAPSDGHRWVVCSQCKGQGEILGRTIVRDTYGGQTIRCPKCFRLGYVEQPIPENPAARQPTAKDPPSYDKVPLSTGYTPRQEGCALALLLLIGIIVTGLYFGIAMAF